MDTIKLYDSYPYEDKFEGCVLSCEKKGDLFDVVLDQTLFFPEQGGQTCDTGTLNGIEVVDVQMKDEIVHHYVKKPLEGMVKGCIDFDTRYEKMQHHTCEHVMSSVMIKLFGIQNVGFHLGSDATTVDFERSFTAQELETIENEVNDLIYQNIKVNTYFLEDGRPLEYRSKKEINGKIRIVDIEGIDICACCAPHVSHTGEIGLFKILRMDKHKKGVRITFIAGKKAFDDYRIKFDQAHDLSVLLKVPGNEIQEPVHKLVDENTLLKQQVMALKKEIIQYKLDSLDVQDYHIIVEEGMDMNVQRIFGNQLLDKTKKVSCIFVPVDQGYRFVMVSQNNVMDVLNTLRKGFQIKGGGKGNMAQGTMIGNLEEIIQTIKEILK